MNSLPILKTHLRLISCTVLMLCATTLLAQSTNVIYNDTFTDDGSGLVSRNDDAGPGFGLDIQWRPRISSQAGAYSIINDTVFGSALQFHNTANNLWIIGQFDNNAADGITFGSSSVPVSLGSSSGDTLICSFKVRTGTTLSSGVIKCGYTFVAGGPRPNDPISGENNTWMNPCDGYYIVVNSATPGQVPTWKQTGVSGSTPFATGTSTTLTNGLPGVNAAIGDTAAHTIAIKFTRLVGASIQIDSFVDGALVSSAVDSTSPYTQFNSFLILYTAVADYIFDDVQAYSTSSDVPYQPPVAVADSYTVTKNGSLSVAAPGVLANDSAYTNAPMTAIKLTDPAHGTLTAFNSDGSFVYTPASNYFGTDSFTYKANDAYADSAPATVTLNVLGRITWTGAVSSSWLEAANWLTGDLPGGQSVRYDNMSTAHLIQTLDQNWAITGITVSNVPGPVTISNGLTLTNTGSINMANATADLTIWADYAPPSTTSATIAAGRTLTVSNVFGSLNNAAGPGTLRVCGAVTGTLLDLTGSLTLLLDGGSVAGTPPLRLAAESGGTVRAVLTNNALVDLHGGNASKINVGNNASTNGNNILTLQSGTIKVAASSGTGANGIFVPSSTCYGIFNLNGGTVYMTNKQTAIDANSAETTLRVPAAADGNGIVNLNGGVLVTPRFDSVTLTTGSGTVNFNGTTVVANRSNSTWIAGIQNTFVLAGGAIFDSSNYDVTIAQSLSAPLAGQSGGLTKLGTGILRLTGYNSYTGPTIVGAGTLAVAASVMSYPSTSPLVLSNGAALTADVSGGSSIATPSMVLNSAALNIDYGILYGNPFSPAFENAPDGVVLSATGSNVVNIAGSGFVAGDINLLHYSGTIGGGGFAAIHLGKLPIGMSGTLLNDSVNKMIVLRLSRVPALLTWYGDKSASWDTLTANWNGGAAVYTEAAGFGDAVTFDDSLESLNLRTNVNLTAVLKPVSITFNGYSANYRLTGSGKLSGAGALLKDGTASVTLGTANDFSGGTVISNGVICVGNDRAFGSGPVSIMGAALSSDSASARAVTNAIFIAPSVNVGMPAVTLGDGINSGSLALSGPVDWSGSACNIVVNNNVIFGGTLLNGGLDVKTGPGTVTFQNATDQSTLGNLQIQDGSMIVSSGVLNRAHGGIRIMALGSPTQRAYFGILGGAAVLLDGGSVDVRVGYAGGDAASTNVLDIAGTLACTTNNLAGSVMLGTNSALAQVNLRSGGLLRISSVGVTGPNTELNCYGGTLAGSSSQAAYLQGLGACYLRNGGVTVNTEGLSGQPLTLTIAQPLLTGGSGGLTKTGLGTLILTGTNTYTGATLVSTGTLQIRSGQPAPGSITVADGANLALAPVTTGVATPLGPVSIGSVSGGTLTVSFAGRGNPTAPAASIGALTLNGTVPVNVDVSGVEAGTIPLLQYTSVAGSGSITTGTLPTGLFGYVTNDTGAKLLKLVITAAPPDAIVFNDTFEPDGAAPGTRNDDAGTGFGSDIQWRPRNNNQGNLYSVIDDAVLGNAMQFNSGSSSFLFTIGQFDDDASDGITFGSSSTPVVMAANVGISLKLSMNFRTTTVLPPGGGTKFALMMAPDGPIPADTTSGNGWTTNWQGYMVIINNANPGAVVAHRLNSTDDPSDSLLKTGTNSVALDGSTGTLVAVGADTNKHTVAMQLTRVTNGWLELDAYWDGALVCSSLDTNPPVLTNFNSVVIAYSAAGAYVYDNVSLSAIKPVAPPIAAPDAYALAQDTSLTVAAPGVLGNDTDPAAYPVSAFRVSGPAHGTLALDSSGGFTYTPTSSYSGPDSFTYQAYNGYAGSPITAVSISVTNSAKVPPVFSVAVSGSNLILGGTGGTPGATAHVLSSTNVALPLSSWGLSTSLVLDSSGSFRITNTINSAQRQLFYRVQLP